MWCCASAGDGALLLLFSLRSAPLPRSWGLLNQLQRAIKRLSCFVFFSFPFSCMFPFFPHVLRVSFLTSGAPFSFLCLLPLKRSSSTSLLSSAASFPLSFPFSFCLHHCLCCLTLSGGLILPGGKMNVLRAAGWRHWPDSLARHWSLYLALLGNCKCCGINGGCTLVPIVDRLLAPALCNLPPRL